MRDCKRSAILPRLGCPLWLAEYPCISAFSGLWTYTTGWDTTGIPSGRFEPAFGIATLSGVAVETDDATGLALRIAPVRAGGRLEPAVPGFWV